MNDDGTTDAADQGDDGVTDAADEGDDAGADGAADVAAPADADAEDSAPAQPRDAGPDTGAKDAGYPCDSGFSTREWCFYCPQPCPTGRVWDTYVCSCIIPGRCDNGWDLCDIATPACVDGKCFECSREELRRCRVAAEVDGGMRCDTEAHKCVAECLTACPPGTERDLDTCECFDFCADGCDPSKPACRAGKCVECTFAEHCLSQTCDTITNKCL